MKQIGLFAGIGGFELAARWVGWETIAVSEIDAFCQKVLQYHFPGAQLHGDIKTTDFTKYRGQCDIITGGFPCQPFSAAGKRRGTADERYLWPEMLRVIDEVKPRWVIGENVRGLVNWDGGLVFDAVCTELENTGYDVQPFVIPACGVNAPHRRDRIWFIANATDGGYRGRSGERRTDQRDKFLPNELKRDALGGEIAGRCGGGNDYAGNVFNASSIGRNALNNEHGSAQQGQSGRKFSPTISTRSVWDGFPIEPPVCSGNDGFSEGLDGITFPKWRKESIKGYGNAIVPQIAYEIYKAIILYEQIGAENE